KEEAQKIVPGETMPELLKGLRELCPVVIITDGVNGAVLADRTEAIWAGLYHPEHVSVDRTGAGDSFCSGFTLQYALGEGLRRSVHYATANSASVVVRIGSKPGILRGDNIDQLDPIEITPLDLTAG
ncbi:MAG: carbohydrate kinase family protein, partial [Candidatus Nanoperiomorbus sp.]